MRHEMAPFRSFARLFGRRHHDHRLVGVRERPDPEQPPTPLDGSIKGLRRPMLPPSERPPCRSLPLPGKAGVSLSGALLQRECEGQGLAVPRHRHLHRSRGRLQRRASRARVGHGCPRHGGGGVPGGLDFGLVAIAEIFGRATAEAVQLQVEYAPAPPFEGGRPENSSAEVTARVRGGMSALLAADKAAVEEAARRLQAA